MTSLKKKVTKQSSLFWTKRTERQQPTDQVEKYRNVENCLAEPTKGAANKWKVTTSHDAKGALGQITEGDLVEEVEADKEGWTVVKYPDGRQGAVRSTALGKTYNLCGQQVIFRKSCQSNQKEVESY